MGLIPKEKEEKAKGVYIALDIGPIGQLLDRAKGASTNCKKNIKIN
jgi:hypothetical protein